MPPSKVRPHCKAIVPLKQKVCKLANMCFESKEERRAEHTLLLAHALYILTEFHTRVRMVFPHALYMHKA